MPDEDELTFSVGAREIYDSVKRTELHVAELRTGLPDLDRRVTALEKWRWAAGGAVALAGSALGWLITLRGGV